MQEQCRTRERDRSGNAFKGCILLSTVIIAFLVEASSGSGIVLGGEPIPEPRKLPLTWTRLDANYGKAPLQFEVNQGQFDEQIKYLARGKGYNLSLTSDAIVLFSFLPHPAGDPVSSAKRIPGRGSRERKGQHGSVLTQLRFVGGNPHPHITGLDERASKTNYILGNDPGRWRTGVATYGRVKYESVYPGIDLIFYGNDGRLEYDIQVSPGAAPEMIQFDLEGADQVSLAETGDLVLGTASGEVRLGRPRIYQESEGRRDPVLGGFRWIPSSVEPNDPSGAKRIGFNIPVYDRDRTLVIDPVFDYSVSLGGTGDDYGDGIAVDKSGYIYVTGATSSADFPVKNSLQPWTKSGLFKSLDGGTEWHILKNTGAPKDFLTLAVDPIHAGTVYAGTLWDGILKTEDGGKTWTSMKDGLAFPVNTLTIDPLNTSILYTVNQDGVILKSSDAGASWNGASNGLPDFQRVAALRISPKTPSTLYASTVITGLPTPRLFKTIDGANTWTPVDVGAFPSDIIDLAIDPVDPATIYLGMTPLLKSKDGGATWSRSDAGLPGDSSQCAPRSFTIDPITPEIVYMGCQMGVFKSLNGGERWNLMLEVRTGILSLVIDPKTPSTLYAVVMEEGIFKTTDGGGTWFSIQEGLTNPDVLEIALDPNTPATLYAATRQRGTFATFVTKLDPTDFSPIYSTYLGGSGEDWGRAIKVDSRGNAYIVGYTDSKDFPATEGTIQTQFGGGLKDAFVAKLNAEGSSLLYSTYLGGSGLDEGIDIALDEEENAYVMGITSSPDFPVTEGAFDTTYNGADWVKGYDVFVSKLNPTGTSLVYSTYLGGRDSLEMGSDVGTGIAVDRFGQAFVTGYTDSIDFPTTEDAFQRTRAGTDPWWPNTDAFLTQLNAEGSGLVYSTYIGPSNENESGRGLALDAEGNAFITGTRPDSIDGVSTVFIGRLARKSFEFLGTLKVPVDLVATQIALDNSGNIYLAGFIGYYYAGGNWCDGFLAKIDSTGNTIIGIFGGSDLDGAWGMAIDSNRNIYVAGTTASSDFSTGPGGKASSYGGGFDAFVAKFRDPSSLAIKAPSLPEGEAGVNYNGSLAIDGGYPPYKVEIMKGELPEGLTVSPGGIVAGIPQKGERRSFSVRVTDQIGSRVEKSFSIKIFKAVAISTKKLKKGKTGKSYNMILKATGGKPPYVWSPSSGFLPEDLTLDPATGKIVGTPKGSGEFPLVYHVADALGGQSEKEFTLVIE